MENRTTTTNYIQKYENVFEKSISVNEKLDIISGWLNEHNQYVVDRIKSINDVFKLYQYCTENNIEYFDSLDDSVYYTQAETDKFQKELFELLGYSIF